MKMIKLSEIKPSPKPVRTQIDKDKLAELSVSIQENGVIVPIKVRPTKDDQYEIVYGHRRAQASRLANLLVIPCIIEEMQGGEAYVSSLIENVMREDMNDADVSVALNEIKKNTGKTWREVGLLFGWNENQCQRLGSITKEEGNIIRTGTDLSGEHARMARQAGKDSTKVLKKAKKEGLSKRQTEAVAKSVAVTKDPRRKQALIDAPYDPYMHDPDYNKERADTYGEHDPITPKGQPAQSWDQTPDVKLMLSYIKASKENAYKTTDMDTAGKFAPEARPFMVTKIKGMISAWNETITTLEKTK